MPNQPHSIQPKFFVALTTLATWMFFYLFGHLRDFVRQRLEKSKKGKGYARIRQDYEDFYTRRMYYRIHDCFNRPIASAPDRVIDVLTRTPVSGQKPLTITGSVKRCLNLGSYNYLGFAASDAYCTPRVLTSLEELGWSSCSARSEAGTTSVHKELEKSVADFVGKEDAITFGMGFATNSVGIPALVGKGCLIISDALNHSSIVAGVRGSGAKVKVFKHNDPGHLEILLKAAVAYGQPRTHRPWKKIMIVIEGIYSMEGEICRLAEIVALKKKYKAYLYLDEAHSIGALGATGRGICEHAGVSPADVDVMMGTFTKSFGSCGGYLAADRSVVQCLRVAGAAQLYAGAMSPPAAEQIISALKLIQDADGSGRGPRKLTQLRENSNYFREKLQEIGLNVLGDRDSPVMPIMLYHPGKIASFSRLTLERGIAAVVVGFPATPLLTSRARVCISASHTRKDLDRALKRLALLHGKVLEDVADLCLLRYNGSGQDDVEVNGKESHGNE